MRPLERKRESEGARVTSEMANVTPLRAAEEKGSGRREQGIDGLPAVWSSQRANGLSAPGTVMSLPTRASGTAEAVPGIAARSHPPQRQPAGSKLSWKG